MTERAALLLSTGVALLIGLAALVVGLVTRSGAILLDSAFNIGFFATALLTLRIARLLERPDDTDYPFGYAQYAPLINLVKALLILGTGLIAGFDAVRSIIVGSELASPGLALTYAVVALVLCLSTYSVLRLRADASSPLVSGDIANWLVNTIISAGMCTAFIGVILFEGLGWLVAARLVDPVLVILVVAGTALVPINMVRDSLSSFLRRAPNDERTAEVAAIVASASSDLSPRDIVTRVVSPGGETYVLSHIVLRPELGGMTLSEADTRRQAIIDGLRGAVVGPLVADINFTLDESLARQLGGSRRIS
ncbi:MAG TPA: cation transporter [Devosia sp.]|nr:cation transporter [Devosia sp.]